MHIHVSTSPNAWNTRPFVSTARPKRRRKSFGRRFTSIRLIQIGETHLRLHCRRKPTFNNCIEGIRILLLHISGQRPPSSLRRFTGPLLWHASKNASTPTTPPLPYFSSRNRNLQINLSSLTKPNGFTSVSTQTTGVKKPATRHWENHRIPESFYTIGEETEQETTTIFQFLKKP